MVLSIILTIVIVVVVIKLFGPVLLDLLPWLGHPDATVRPSRRFCRISHRIVALCRPVVAGRDVVRAVIRNCKNRISADSSDFYRKSIEYSSDFYENLVDYSSDFF